MIKPIVFGFVKTEKIMSKNGISDKYAEKELSNFKPYKKVLNTSRMLISVVLSK
jgi:hypothetical protein